jgi:hypothetical protein
MELTLMNHGPDIHVVAIDDLNLSRCVVGPDLIARFVRDSVTVYRRFGHTVEFLGRFDTPEEALATIDEIDAPAPRVEERPASRTARRAAGARLAA